MVRGQQILRTTDYKPYNMPTLIHNLAGHYHFLQGIDPYSCGVVADPGYEVVQVTLRETLPWANGLKRVDHFLNSYGLSRSALCGTQLRCPSPYTIEDFIDFNNDFCAVLREWGLFLGDLNPLARTNVAPVVDGPRETELYAFSYIRPAPNESERTFVVAGAGELRDGVLEAERIVRCGETSTEAMQEKASFVAEVMAERLQGLGVDWRAVNRVNVYTVHPLDHLLDVILLPCLGVGARQGLHIYRTRPPVMDIEFEMDVRGVGSDLFLSL